MSQLKVTIDLKSGKPRCFRSVGGEIDPALFGLKFIDDEADVLKLIREKRSYHFDAYSITVMTPHGSFEIPPRVQ